MEMTENKEERTLEWSHFQLPNIPIYQTKLPQDIMDRLWGYVDKAKEKNSKWNSHLAGNIDSSFLLEDEDNYFMRYVVGPVADLYVKHTHSVHWVQRNHNYKSNSLVMEKIWVNFQNKHEYNPVHSHSGIVSFVIWMKIPTHHEQQHALPICKNSNAPVAGDFQFMYSDMLGGLQDYTINMGDYQEGWMLVFPSQLRHLVYPFYECDEQRVSISGNVSWNAMDIES